MDAPDARLRFEDGAAVGAADLAAVPASAGVAQLLDGDQRPLVTARAANLRRWALTKLSAPKPAGPGRRPPLDLRPLARALRHARTTSAFHQRLVFERWMAEEVPLQKRRDLPTPGYLRLDLAERFPRLRPCTAEARDAFGPFRDRRAAEAACKPLHKLFPLRPCDYDFEPDPALPLGLGCLYAQVRTCAAPCLARLSEPEYGVLARRAAAFLADPQARPAETQAWLPAWLARADGPALLVERTRAGIELWPLRDGGVLDAHVLRFEGKDAREQALARVEALAQTLARDDAASTRDDRPWVSAHLHGKPRATTYVPLPGDLGAPALAARLRAWLRE